MKKSNFLKTILFVGLICSTNLVFSQNPNWQINAADYSLDASIIGQVKIDNQVAVDTNDQIALFDANDEIRGVTNVSYNSSLDTYLFFLTAHANANGEILHFKIYDASEDKVISTNETISFEPNKVYGTVAEPLLINGDSTLNTVAFSNPENLKVFPNPVVDEVHISANSTIQSLAIFSILGKKVKEIKLNTNEINVAMNDLKNGVYLLYINLKNKNTMVRKMIKK